MSGKTEIREVKGRSMLKKFVNYPNILYKDVPQFVPAFYGDDLADWDPKKNPAFEYCEAKAFLAYRDGKIVGRIGAILSKRANELWKTNRMRFSQVDFIDDDEVVDALFGAVESWAKEKGCDELQGPLGFCDMDREGMLVEGFDRRSMFITYYNHPYYIKQMERMGFVKDADWIEHKIAIETFNGDFRERVSRLSKLALKRGGYHKVKLTSRKQYKPYINKVFNLVNEAYAPLYGVVDLNKEQIKKYENKFVPLINPDLVCLVVDDNDDLAAFGVAAPSMAEALKKSRGRLSPFGWIGVLKALKKNDAIDMLLMAVKPELQGNSGLNCVVMDHILEGCIKNGILWSETGPQLELNEKMHGQWSMVKAVPHKRRRCFVKKI